jgi:hypothetical protein
MMGINSLHWTDVPLAVDEPSRTHLLLSLWEKSCQRIVRDYPSFNYKITGMLN